MRLPRSPALWTLVAVGTAARLIVAFATYGHEFDIESFVIVRNALADDPLNAYSAVTADFGDGVEQLRWPYPPAFFAWIAATAGLDGPLGLPFHGLIQVPSILADAAIAILVYAFLRGRGGSERTALLAAALVSLGPVFAAVSGYHGQIDAVAILPAVAALIVWESKPARRATLAGLLIGLGAAVKTVPLLLVLALLPSARDRSERIALVASAAAVPAVALAPFLLADPGGVSELFGYNGVPGVAGLSLVLQPGLAADWLTAAPLDLTPASEALFDASGAVTILFLALFTLFVLRVRPSALDAAVLLWLGVYAFSPNLFLHYAVWGLPFLLLAGYLSWAIAAEAALVVPLVLVYAIPWPDAGVTAIYAPLVIALWAASLIGFVVLARRMLAASRPDPDGVAPPLVRLAGSR